MKKFSKFLLLLMAVSIVASNSCFAQLDSLNTSHKKNGVYLELLGTGIFYSVNYERILDNKVTLRGGFSIMPKVELDFAGQINSGLIFPISSSYLIPTKREGSYIELGAGGSVFLVKNSFGKSIGGILGFREQDFLHGGVIVRLNFIPTYFFDSEEGFIPSAGLSLGYSF